MPRQTNYLILILALAAAVTIVGWPPRPAPEKSVNFNSPISLDGKADGDLIIVQLGGKASKLDVLAEIAKSSAKRTRGLSGRASLDPNRGMLFIFPTDTQPGFWMKDMNFPLDFVWLDNNLQIVGLTKNISPNSFPKLFYPPRPIRYVLEINAGISDKIGLKTGDRLTEFPSGRLPNL